MPFTDLNTLFETDEFTLPFLATDDTKSFLYHFGVRMQQYTDKLKTVPQIALNEWNKEELIDNVSYIAEELSEVLRLFLDGFPAQSYMRFKELAELPKLAARLMHWRTISLDTNTPLYRTKREFDTKKIATISPSNGFIKFLDPLELFHVPFEKRKAIGTNRFSIPGFPCIYLSANLQTSWSEALGDIKYPFHAASFRNHRPVYIVDVVPVQFATPATATVDYLATLYNYDDPTDALVDYALIFPLITACHSKVHYTSSYDGEVKFKSEYIIPQLLLQWYRDNHITVDGIRYLSCTAEATFPNSKFEKINYVIPAVDIKEEGYCDSLLHNYSATPVYSRLQNTGISTIELLDDITRELGKTNFTPLK